MNLTSKSRTEPVTFKLSPSTLFKFEQIAELRGVTRSTLLNEIVEATIDGQLVMDLPSRFAEYSTRRDAPNVARDERIEARLVDMAARDIARAKSIVAESEARLKAAGVFEMVDL
jgi:hypothetical protein